MAERSFFSAGKRNVRIENQLAIGVILKPKQRKSVRDCRGFKHEKELEARETAAE